MEENCKALVHSNKNNFRNPLKTGYAHLSSARRRQLVSVCEVEKTISDKLHCSGVFVCECVAIAAIAASLQTLHITHTHRATGIIAVIATVPSSRSPLCFGLFASPWLPKGVCRTENAKERKTNPELSSHLTVE